MSHDPQKGDPQKGDPQKGDPQKSLEQRVTSLENSLEQLKRGLGLLGLQPCVRCNVFYRRSDPGALFHYDEFVCFKCVPLWWAERCPQISISERKKSERELRQWLVSHHHAEVIRRPANLPEHYLLKLVTSCEDCDGSGKTPSGGICRHCDGRGTVWVVIRAPDFGRSSK